MALTKKQLDELRTKLDGTLVDIKSELGEIETDKGEMKQPDFGSDVDGNEDLSEEADETEELTADIGIAAGLKERLEDVENALRKMDKGAYGKCEKCGEEISWEVLSAVPESRYCKTHKAGK